MKTEELCARINALDPSVKEPLQIEILKEVELPDAVMYVVHWSCNNGFDDVSSFILYDDGTLFHQYDWQCGHPETADEIADFDWLSEYGTHAVMLGGLPRTFA